MMLVINHLDDSKEQGKVYFRHGLHVNKAAHIHSCAVK